MAKVDPFSFMDLLDATSGGGTMRISWDGNVTRRVCLHCDEAFEQTDEGFAALKQHEFEHGAATTCDLSELDGKTLRIMVVKSIDKKYGFDSKSLDVWGVDDADGTVYHLSNPYTTERAWKWKFTQPTQRNDGQRPTPNVLALLSSGYANTDEK